MKKVLIGILILAVIIFIIIPLLNSSKFGYSILPKSESKKIHYLFKDSVRKELECVSVGGNNFEKQYRLLYKKHRILLWEIKGYKDINPSLISLVYKDINEPSFSNYLKCELHNPDLKLKWDEKLFLTRSNLCLEIPDETSLLNILKGEDYLLLDIKLTKLILSGNCKNDQIYIESDGRELNTELFFLNSGKNFYFFIINDYDKSVQKNYILNILEID